jgi:DNA-binding protein HU-beta
MKKSEFVAEVAKKAGVTRVEADKVVNAALNVITDTLQSGDKVTLTGFGTFEVRQRAERAGMNIRTKEKIRIPASTRPVFSAGAVLRGAVGNKSDNGKKASGAKAGAKASSAKAPASSAKAGSSKSGGKSSGGKAKK